MITAEQFFFFLFSRAIILEIIFSRNVFISTYHPSIAHSEKSKMANKKKSRLLIRLKQKERIVCDVSKKYGWDDVIHVW